MSQETQFIVVKVFRYDPSVDSEPRYDSFQVPYDAQETILGVLKYIAKHHDPSLAFRESCRTGSCTLCNIRINGGGGMACRKTMKDVDSPEIILDPFRKESVIRDLICAA